MNTLDYIVYFIKDFWKEVRISWIYIFVDRNVIETGPMEMPTRIIILLMALIILLVILKIAKSIIRSILSFFIDRSETKDSKTSAEIKRKQLLDKKHYKKRTGSSLKDIGDAAEIECFEMLKSAFPNMKVFHDLYPNYINNDGKQLIAQCDIVGVTDKNIYVIEVKSYSGVVFPTDDTYWIHTDYDNYKENGTGEYRYNPVRQNHGHIKVICGLLQREIPQTIFNSFCQNVVVFADRTMIVYPGDKNKSNPHNVINMENLIEYIKEKEKNSSNHIASDEINTILEKYSAENVDSEIKEMALNKAKLSHKR